MSTPDGEVDEWAAEYVLPRDPARVGVGHAQPPVQRAVRADRPHLLVHARHVFERDFTICLYDKSAKFITFLGYYNH